MDTKNCRLSGILMHPTSLPSPYGVGDLGKGAYEFVDFLEKAGQHLWQILPLTPTSFGDSPYQGFSAFAGQPLLISPEHLVELGFLKKDEIEDAPNDDEKVQYGEVITWKNTLFKKAFERFLQTESSVFYEKYEFFVKKQAYWLEDYALYMACKDFFEGKEWLLWEEEYKHPTALQKQKMKQIFQREMQYYYFLQFLFESEWSMLKTYANEKGIEIIGDMPLFVSLDSADVWAHQELFQLDTKGFPIVVAGVPPDYFSETGQLWGNPLYAWDVHQKENFAWWVSRVRHQLQLTDYLRIDHFRGLEAYWAVPYGSENAIQGEWMKAPGKAMFLAVKKALGSDIPIIAEDLGLITEEVEELRDFFGFPGMKVLQFGFEPEEENDFLPHQFTSTNCICYTGTHDNNTTKGWYEEATEYSRDKVRCYMNTDGNQIHWDFLRICLGSIAKFAVFPMQDVLGCDAKGRMNTPGTREDNWTWRCPKKVFHKELADNLKKITHLYGR